VDPQVRKIIVAMALFKEQSNVMTATRLMAIAAVLIVSLKRQEKHVMMRCAITGPIAGFVTAPEIVRSQREPVMLEIVRCS
jgi:hypothetical protein